MCRTKFFLLPFHSSYSFFLDPRTSLNNACQRLFGKNSSKMPQYTYKSEGPPHRVTWTATVYSQFLSIIHHKSSDLQIHSWRHRVWDGERKDPERCRRRRCNPSSFWIDWPVRWQMTCMFNLFILATRSTQLIDTYDRVLKASCCEGYIHWIFPSIYI